MQRWTDFESKSRSNETVVCPKFGTAYGPGDEYILAVASSNDDIVKKVPMFEPWMHPRGLQLVGQLEERVSNREIILRTKIHQAQPVFVDITYSVLSDYSIPDNMI